ncbi:hypothetical protein JXO52_00880 [bacterium]|nr:hypothetical protein [bacterium]
MRETGEKQRERIDWRQFRALLRVSITMDFRGHRGLNQQQRKKISPLWWSMIFYALMSMGLSGGLVPVATPFLYTFLILSYSMVMVVFSVILEFSNSIINPDDGDIMGFRPINSRTYFSARLCNLLFYVWMISTALCLFPAVIGLGVKGMPPFFPLVFYPVALLANWTAAAFVVWVYTGLLQIMPYSKFKDFLAHLQIIFSFLVFFSYQLVPRLAGRFIQAGEDITASWLHFAPPAWFAAGVQLLVGRGREIDPALALTAVAVMLLLFFLAFRNISVGYARRIAELQSQGEGRKRDPAAAGRGIRPARTRESLLPALLCTTPAARAGYRMTVTMLKRDRSVKMSVYPLLGMPFAFIALALIEGDLQNPFTEGMFSGEGTYGNIVMFFIFFMAYTLFNVMLYADDWKAAWIFQAAPLSSPGQLFYGLKLAVYLRALCPFLALLFIVYALNFGPIHAGMLVLMFAGLGHLSLSLASLLAGDFPFSKPRVRGDRTRTLTALLIIAPLFGLLMFFFALLKVNPLFWWLYMALMIPAAWGAEKIARKRLDRKFARAACEQGAKGDC